MIIFFGRCTLALNSITHQISLENSIDISPMRRHLSIVTWKFPWKPHRKKLYTLLCILNELYTLPSHLSHLPFHPSHLFHQLSHPLHLPTILYTVNTLAFCFTPFSPAFSPFTLFTPFSSAFAPFAPFSPVFASFTPSYQTSHHSHPLHLSHVVFCRVQVHYP